MQGKSAAQAKKNAQIPAHVRYASRYLRCLQRACAQARRELDGGALQLLAGRWPSEHPTRCDSLEVVNESQPTNGALTANRLTRVLVRFIPKKNPERVARPIG